MMTNENSQSKCKKYRFSSLDFHLARIHQPGHWTIALKEDDMRPEKKICVQFCIDHDSKLRNLIKQRNFQQRFVVVAFDLNYLCPSAIRKELNQSFIVILETFCRRIK